MTNHLKNLSTNPLARMIIGAVGFVFVAGVIWATSQNDIKNNRQLAESHIKDQVVHMEEDEVAAIVEIRSDVDRAELDIRRVEVDLKADLAELKTDMNRGFDKLEQLIRDGGR